MNIKRHVYSPALISPDGSQLLLDICGSGDAYEVATLDLSTGEIRTISGDGNDSIPFHRSSASFLR